MLHNSFSWRLPQVATNAITTVYYRYCTVATVAARGVSQAATHVAIPSNVVPLMTSVTFTIFELFVISRPTLAVHDAFMQSADSVSSPTTSLPQWEDSAV